MVFGEDRVVWIECCCEGYRVFEVVDEIGVGEHWRCEVVFGEE